MVRELVTDPESYLGRKATDRGLSREIGVLLLIGAFGAIGVAYVAQFVLGTFPGTRDNLRLSYVSNGAAVFFGPFILWAYYAAVLQVGLRFSNDRGPISRLLKVIPWALVPIAVGNLVSSIVAVIAVRGTEIPSEIPGTSPGAEYAYVSGLYLDDPLFLVAALVMVVLIGYSAYLMAIGVSLARDVDYDTARRVTGVAAAGHGLYVAYTALKAAGFL